MKKRLIAALCAALILTCALCASAEDWTPLTSEDGWSYIGYTFGGITFAVPNDYRNYNVSASYASQGYVIMGGTADFTIQMRVFQPDQLVYDEFKAMIGQESTAEISTRMDGDYEILVYRNTRPSANSELCGIVMTGLDGLLYKISIFTGDDGAFDENAPVWAIAETIARSARHQDFSEWGVEDTPDTASDNLLTRLSDFLNSLIPETDKP